MLSIGEVNVPSVASVDCSWALRIIASFDVIMMSVGHLNPSPAIFMGISSSFVGNNVV